MPGDEAQPEIQGGTPQLRTGPRHAAPRKSLLTRVHVPAGKAIALAAMPTAVLMGMGLTPRLAQAAEPKNTFTGDHCVSQSDTPSPSASSSAKPSASPTPSASPSAKAPAGKASGGSKAKPAPAKSASASPSKSASKSTDPSDPLGLGGVLGGLLGGLSGSGGSGSTPSPSATPSATPKPAHSSSGSGLGGSLTKTVGGLTKTVTGAASGATKGVQKAVGSATDPSPSVSPGQGYPCPTYNAKALADAGLEQTSSLLPNQPWVLKTDKLTLTGLKYDGIVKVETENGTVKNVLKFTATGVDILNLHQIVQGPDGTEQHVQAAPGSTSTIRNGTVTLYTQELKGNLLGLIPIDFTPDSPPPLTIPTVFFTDVTVTQAGQFGGTLHIPGLHGYATS